MCGIFGYVGKSAEPDFIIKNLKKIDYRGYDSAGLSVINYGQIKTVKSVGRVDKLTQKVGDLKPSLTGIGHTRWATHGEPSDINSHPHLSSNSKIAIVHNGIIENYKKLKSDLIKKGYQFVSQTDSEVIANLVASYYKENDFIEAVKKAVADLEGSYAVAVINQDQPEQIVAFASQSPLILGLADDFKLLSSDVISIVKYTDQVHYMNENELAVLTKDKVEIVDIKTNQTIDYKVDKLTQTAEAAELGQFADFTSKEIYSEPAVIKTILDQYQEGDDLNLAFSKNFNKIVISACGTAYHAGLIGKHYLENVANIPVSVELASEFNYKKVFIDDQTLFIAISQSGETRDTLNAMLKAKQIGAECLALVNVIGSQIARKADYVVYTLAGTEVGVASTKAYLSQTLSLLLIAQKLAGKSPVKDVSKLPDQIKQVLRTEDQVKKLASQIAKQNVVFFTGRGVDLNTADEAALKLKELSYINTFAIGSGELKHGTIALIDQKTTAIAILTQPNIVEKTLSNLKEINARDGKIIIVTNLDHDFSDLTSDVIKIPKVDPYLAPILSIIPLQLLAYHTAKLLDRDVDKPRNLAKAVTVE